MLRARQLGRSLGERVLFEGLDLEVEQGLTWVRGPSGVGKSQLLRRVAGLVPGPGELTLDGTSSESLGMPVWRTRVALVSQEPPRWTQTALAIWERVADLAAQRERPSTDPRELTERWGLRADRWEQPMDRLSGGEAQRVWLALVLSREPDIVLLDEPTSALDDSSVAAVEADLVGLTGLLVTHDAEQARRLTNHTVELA